MPDISYTNTPNAQVVPPVRTVSSAYTVDINDYTIFVSTTSNNVTVTLPTAVGIPGKIYEIKKITTDTNVMTIQPNGADLIDGASNKSTTSTVQPSYKVQSDGTGWKLL